MHTPLCMVLNFIEAAGDLDPGVAVSTSTPLFLWDLGRFPPRPALGSVVPSAVEVDLSGPLKFVKYPRL